MTTTICWDCKNATGGCSWSKYLTPVKGWKADLIEETQSKPYTTYSVNECPKFIRDGINGGQKKYTGKD